MFSQSENGQALFYVYVIFYLKMQFLILDWNVYCAFLFTNLRVLMRIFNLFAMRFNRRLNTQSFFFFLKFHLEQSEAMKKRKIQSDNISALNMINWKYFESLFLIHLLYFWSCSLDLLGLKTCEQVSLLHSYSPLSLVYEILWRFGIKRCRN